MAVKRADSLEIVIEQVGLEGSFERGRRQSGRMFEANCSKQMGQCKKNDLSAYSFVFTQGMTK